MDIISDASHHLVAFVNPDVAGTIPEGNSTDQLLSQEGSYEQVSPTPSPIQPARAHSTSPRALHGRSPPVGVVPTDWVAATATSQCMPDHVSRDDSNGE